MNISPPVLRLPKSGRIADKIRARRAQPSIDSGTLETVLGRFGLEAVGGAHNLPHGWRNAMVRIATSIGPIVIKRYPQRWPEATIAHEHSIIDELGRLGFPAVAHHTHDGSSWFQVDNSFFSATHFVDGGYNAASVYMSDGQRSRLIEKSGAMLASFHDGLRGFEPTGVHHADSRPGWWDRSDPPATGIQVTAGDPLLVPADVIESISSLDHELAGRTPVGVIHADFGLHNILLRRGDSAVLHDFELARVDYQLADVAIAIARLPNRMTSAFLHGYRGRSELVEPDWESFHLVWRRHWYSAALRSLTMYGTHGGSERLETAKKRLSLAATAPEEKGYTR